MVCIACAFCRTCSEFVTTLPRTPYPQAVLLTKKDTFLTKDQYCLLVYSALEGLPRYQSDPSARIHLLPPAILKPTPLWTGKQVISSLLFGLTGDIPEPACFMNLDRKAKVSAKMWGEADKLPGLRLCVLPC